MFTPRDCPGFEKLKHISSFSCKCPKCKKEVEIFSDEFDKEHKCKNCGGKIDFSKCEMDVSA